MTETNTQKVRRLLGLDTPQAVEELSDETIGHFLDDHNQNVYVAAVWVARYYINRIAQAQPQRAANLQATIDDLLRATGGDAGGERLIILGSDTAIAVTQAAASGELTQSDLDAHTADEDAHHAQGRVTGVSYTAASHTLTVRNSDGSQHSAVLPDGQTAAQVAALIATHAADDDAHHTPTVDTNYTNDSLVLGSNNVLTLTDSNGDTVTVDLSTLASAGGGSGGVTHLGNGNMNANGVLSLNGTDDPSDGDVVYFSVGTIASGADSNDTVTVSHNGNSYGLQGEHASSIHGDDLYADTSYVGFFGSSAIDLFGVVGGSALVDAQIDAKIATHTADDDAHHSPGLSSAQVNALIATHAADDDAHHTPTLDTNYTNASLALGTNNVLTLTDSNGDSVTVDLSSLAGSGGGGGGFVAPTTVSETRFEVALAQATIATATHDDIDGSRHSLVASLVGNSEDFGIASNSLRCADNRGGIYSLSICVDIAATGGNRKTFRPRLDMALAGSPTAYTPYWCGTTEYMRDAGWRGNSIMYTVNDIVLAPGDRLRFTVLAREDASSVSTIDYTTGDIKGRIWRRTA